MSGGRETDAGRGPSGDKAPQGDGPQDAVSPADPLRTATSTRRGTDQAIQDAAAEHTAQTLARLLDAPPSDDLAARLARAEATWRERRSPALDAAFEAAALPVASHRAWGPEAVELGAAEELPCPQARERLRQLLRAMMPWRKGPWRIFGEAVDAEWRSDWKWQRLHDFGVCVRGRRVCDVGASNGWYLYRMLADEPAAVVGVEPQVHALQMWEVLRAVAPEPRVCMTPLGVEDLPAFGRVFDVILLMGILYHHTDPVGVLRRCREALAPGGELVVETIVVPGDEVRLLLPEGRYTGARGFWFLPTRPALEVMLRRAGWRTLEVSEAVATTPQEQRTTAWREGASLAEGLDPSDPTRSVEGLPAPLRVIVRARL